jgi:hypothetical protein
MASVVFVAAISEVRMSSQRAGGQFPDELPTGITSAANEG